MRRVDAQAVEVELRTSCLVAVDHSPGSLCGRTKEEKKNGVGCKKRIGPG